jgi:hypothetical protein
MPGNRTIFIEARFGLGPVASVNAHRHVSTIEYTGVALLYFQGFGPYAMYFHIGSSFTRGCLCLKLHVRRAASIQPFGIKFRKQQSAPIPIGGIAAGQVSDLRRAYAAPQDVSNR